MTVARASGQRIQMEAVLFLAPNEPQPREELERLTMEVDDALGERMLDLTDGASAAANFEEGYVEIDVVLEGSTMAELYQKIALLVTQLDSYCESVTIEGPPDPDEFAVRVALAVKGSQMRRVEPADTELVPA